MNTSAFKLVSVIIPVYNGERFISQTIESVLNQTYPLIENIVVDDGSVDNTQAICARYPSVSYIYQSNQGVNSTRNRGLQESRGQFLVFLDHDDLLLPGAIATGVTYAEAHPDAAFVFGLIRMISASGSVINNNPECFAVANYELLLKAEIRIAPPAAVLFRRDILEMSGGFDSTLKLAEDYELYLRIAREFPIYCHNQVIVDYRCHEGNVSAKVMPMMKATLKVLESQQNYIKGNPAYEIAYEMGKRQWVSLWCCTLAARAGSDLKNYRFMSAIKASLLVLLYRPVIFFRYLNKLKSLVSGRTVQMAPCKTPIF